MMKKNYWKALVASITVLTFAVFSCTAISSDRDSTTHSSQNSQLLRTISTSGSGYSIAYSPAISKAKNSPVDSALLASGGSNVKLWNLSAGKLLRTFRGQSWVVSFSPNGEILASGSQDGTLKLWNVSTGKLIRTFKHSQPISDAVFSPDGQILASGPDFASKIKLWNLSTGETISIPDDPSDTFNVKTEPIGFSPDSQYLFARNASGSATKLWNISSGKLIRSFDAKSYIETVAISPDGKILATGLRDNAIKLWNVNTGELIRTLIGHAGQVMTVAFSPDGKTLASGSWDDTIKLWNVNTNNAASETIPEGLIATFKGHKDKVWSVAFNPDGKTLASTSQDDTIKIWRVPSQ